ncbi:MAG TPA: PQQ-binding-like beta-propeller repeat protein [Pseudonocardiaceae bacterium]
MRWVVAGVTLALALGTVAGCSGSSNGGPPPVPPSTAAQVWSLVDGFENWPALPENPPGTWSLKLSTVFPTSDGDVPGRPYPPGLISGLISPTQLVAYGASTGKPVWHATLPPLAAPEKTNDNPLVESLQVPGLDLIAVTRDVALPGSNPQGSQLDFYDANSGHYLFSRSGVGVSTPMLLDPDHALFDLTDAGGGLDEVDPRTGKLLWHNPNVAACSVYVGKILCETSDVKSIALVDPATGATSWTASYPHSTAGAAYSTSAVIGDEGYFTDGSSTKLTAINLSTGHVDWQQDPGIDIIDAITPLGADRIAVAGLVQGPSGSTERLLSMSVRTGASTTIYAGTDTNGSNSSNGGLSAIRVGSTEYLVVIDPDGSIRTFDANGRQIAVLAADCAAVADVVGDTLGCASTNGYTLYALPGLGVRGSLNAGNNTSVAVVGGVLLVNVDDDVRPFKP